MSKRERPARPKAALPRGFRDASGEEVRSVRRMLDRIAAVYEAYGFEPLSTPAFETTEALGKFLPDQDRPNEGVFSLQDDDGQWLSLRYDLTAPLARYVAENYDALPKPFRRYQFGPVWRNEKPGPGRFREFMQMDADTVGTANPAADAEMCMLAADALEAIGISRGDYVIKVSNRKLLDGVLDGIGVVDQRQRLIVLRAIDKLDRLGLDGVVQLLGKGRKDESGDVTKGADLSGEQIQKILGFLTAPPGVRQPGDPRIGTAPGEIPVRAEFSGESVTFGVSNRSTVERLESRFPDVSAFREGLSELSDIIDLLENSGYSYDRVAIDPSVVRGLEYYTGPVFEAELTFDITDDEGRPIRFGSVGGGGRYDGLVGRFRGQDVPATGFSVGVSRLSAALAVLGRHDAERTAGPVVVLVMDEANRASSERMARELRSAGIRAETYLGTSGMGAQLKYADRRGAPAVVIEGSDERAKGVVTVKDLIEGKALSASIGERSEWTAARPAQVTVEREKLLATVAEFLARHGFAPACGTS